MAPGSSCHSRPACPAFPVISKAQPMPLESVCFPTSQYLVTVRPHRWWCWPRRISQLLLWDSFDGLLCAEFLLRDQVAPMSEWPPHLFSALFFVAQLSLCTVQGRQLSHQLLPCLCSHLYTRSQTRVVLSLSGGFIGIWTVESYKQEAKLVRASSCVCLPLKEQSY